MRRFAAALLAFAFFALPAAAQNFGGFPLAVLMGGGCTNTLKVDVLAGSYCVSRQRFSKLTSAPSVTFSRAGAAYGVTAAGVLTLFGANVLRQTDQGIITEAAATNLILQSQAFDLSWAQSNISTVADSTAAPDGTTTADKMVENVANSTHSWQQTLAKAASSLTYTASGYFKYNGRGITLVVRDGASNANRAVIGVNLQTCTIAGAATALGTFTSGSGTATMFANSFCRVTLTFTTSTETTLSIRPYTDNGTYANDATAYTGDGVSGFYGWGAQVEQAAVVSSYTPTTTVAASRAVDVLSVAFTPNGTSGSVTYVGGSASPAGTSPLNLGGSSGGAWLGSYITAFSVSP